MKIAEIEVGKRYEDGKGNVREVLAFGDFRLYRGQANCDGVRYRILAKKLGPHPVGSEQSSTRASFAAWARAEAAHCDGDASGGREAGDAPTNRMSGPSSRTKAAVGQRWRDKQDGRIVRILAVPVKSPRGDHGFDYAETDRSVTKAKSYVRLRADGSIDRYEYVEG